jgi:hypothetical protein
MNVAEIYDKTLDTVREQLMLYRIGLHTLIFNLVFALM